MDDDDVDYAEGFEDRRTRHAFVRKVLSIVGVQLLITFLFVALIFLVDEIKIFVLTRSNVWIFFVCVGVTLVIMLVLAYFEKARRVYPINMILLFLFTFCESYIVGYITATKYPNEVLLAFGVTVVVVAVLILFACQSRCDFTGLGPYLIIVVLVLLIMSIVAIFWRNTIFRIVICAIGILLFSIYLIIDIQMILGGKHKYQYDPRDYVMAAISIYIDIIQLFLYILQLIGLIGSDD